MNRALTTLTVALLGTAAAQDISTSLPLTSVGDKLMWTVGDQDLRLVVAAGSRVQLDVYSGQFDPQDYRAAGSYGDERYGAEPVSSTFTLTNQAGEVVRQQDFGVGRPDWQTFLNQDLPEGTYTLRVRTSGNGKNTFALRLNSVSAAVQADRLNVNVQARDWTPVLNVSSPGGSLDLRMYDGDGPGELEAELRDAAGQVFPLKVSGQLAWDRLSIPEAAGNYTLFLRQPASARQYSNTVGFTLQREGNPTPLTIVRADTTGRLNVVAELVLPGGTEPTTAPVTVGERTVQVSGQVTLNLPVAEYAISTPEVPGAAVTLSTPQAEVSKDETAQVRVQIKPEVALNFTADKASVCVGDVVTFTARATTAFAGQTLPGTLRVSLPGGLSPQGGTSLTARIDAAHPAVLSFEARATEAGDFTVAAALQPWNAARTLPVQVLASATQIELRRSGLAPALPGEVVTVALTLTNTSRAAAPYQLTDAPGTGLQALDPVTFGGELAPGETRELSYRARVLGAGGERSTLNATLASSCGSTQAVAGTFVAATPAPVPVPEVVVPPVPEVSPPVPGPVTSTGPAVVITRESTLKIPYDAPRGATQLVVAHTLPGGASYLPGSSQLNGKPLGDPVFGPSGRGYWTTAGAPSGVLTYRVAHTAPLPQLQSPALIGRYAYDRREVLVGSVDLADYAAAAARQSDGAAENAGALARPLNGAVFRDRDRVTVSVRGAPSDSSLPTVNGVPVPLAALGRTELDPAQGSARRDFYGVQLRPGENLITYGDQTSRVYLAGAPSTVQFTPTQLVADGLSPLRLGLKLLDLNGLTPGTPSVTVEVTRALRGASSSTVLHRQTVTLKDGEGVLELPALSAPERFTVRVLIGSGAVQRTFEATPGGGRVGVGFVSAAASLGGNLSSGQTLAYEARAAGYLETPLGGGKLYLAAAGAVSGGQAAALLTTPSGAAVVGQTGGSGLPPSLGTLPTDSGLTLDRDQGLPTSTNPLLRYPLYGDRSSESLPLQGIDPLAFRYEHPSFNLQYRQDTLPVTVFTLPGAPTALSFFTRSNPDVSGFAAYLPAGTLTRTLDASGTRVLALGTENVAQDSETVDLITLDRVTGAQTVRRLTRSSDYSLDPVSGVLYFSRPLDYLDGRGNRTQVRVSYRPASVYAERQLALGAQVSGQVGDLNLAAAAVRMDSGDGHGAVTSLGARARYRTETVNADVLAAYADGVLLNGAAAGQSGPYGFTASARYQSDGYVGLEGGAPGLALNGALSGRLNEQFGLILGGQYLSAPALGSTPASEGGHLNLQGRYGLGAARLGAGLQYGFGNQQGLSALLSGGYTTGPIDLSVDHAQPVGPVAGGVLPTTSVSARYRLGDAATLQVQDVIRWGKGQVASLGLTSRFGATNVGVYYDLPTVDGAGNRARFGADTVLPLNDKLSLALSGSYAAGLGDGNRSWNTGSSLRYSSERLSGSFGVDLANAGDASGTSAVARGGVTYALSDRWSVTLDGTKTVGNAAGTQLAVSAALRDGPWQGLAYLRYQDGVLGGTNGQLVGEVNGEYHTQRFAVRAGLAGRQLVADPGSLTVQPSVSGTYYVNDSLGIGAAARAIYQPSSSFSAYSLGLEGSVRALPGTWLTLGFNPLGFDGITSSLNTRSGLYLRLDLLLDDGTRK